MRLEGKLVLVTGGNSAIDTGIVRRVVKKDARVAFSDRDRDKNALTLAGIL